MLIPSLLVALPADARHDDARAETISLDPVTVTATRREESLQSVPVAVSVVPGNALEDANLNHLEEIVQRIPSADFRPASSTKNVSLFMRGLGTVTTSGGVEPTIATVVDGVVLSHPGQTTMDLLDVDRIEALRGPQGTLFGKNASGGVFNIVTRDPSREQYRYTEVSWYGDHEMRLRGGIATVLAEGVAWGSLTGVVGAHDGNVSNVYSDDSVNGYNKKGLRGKLVLKPAAEAKITLGADYLDSHRTMVPVFMTTPDPGLIAPAILPVTASPGNRNINNNFDTFTNDRNWGLSGQLDWSMAGHVLTSITALRQWDNRQHQDVDMSTLSVVHDQGTVSLRQISEEIRLTSPQGRWLDYVVGAFYQHSQVTEHYQRDIGVIADDKGVAGFSIDNLNYAIFGEGVFHIAPQTHLIAGLRQTHNVVSYDFRRITTGAGTFMHTSFSAHDATSETGYSGRLGVQYDLTPNSMAYATWSRGFKGPAYNVYANMWAPDTQRIAPETSNAYEIGLKTQGFDNRLRLNLALFTAKYDNYQTMLPETLGGTTVMRLVNAGQVETSGLEIDMSIKPDARWEITGALAETRAHVLHFNCTAGLSGCAEDGSTMPFAPKHRLTLGANYYLPVAYGRTMILGGDYRWQSAEQFQLPQNPDTEQSAYGILNASIALDDAMHGWRLSLVGKNLTNRSYAMFMTSQFDGIARIVPRDDQRYFGVNFRKDF